MHTATCVGIVICGIGVELTCLYILPVELNLCKRWTDREGQHCSAMWLKCNNLPCFSSGLLSRVIKRFKKFGVTESLDFTKYLYILHRKVLQFASEHVHDVGGVN